MLEELDAQFGVGDLVDEEMYQQKKKSYGEKSLSGLRVEHDLNRYSNTYNNTPLALPLLGTLGKV